MKTGLTAIMLFLSVNYIQTVEEKENRTPEENKHNQFFNVLSQTDESTHTFVDSKPSEIEFDELCKRVRCISQLRAYNKCLDTFCGEILNKDPNDILAYAQCCDEAQEDPEKCAEQWQAYLACWNAKENKEE